MRDIDVVVVGSANLDLVLPVTSIPAPGDTVLAHSLSRGAGGKGLNQAVAAARAGARTAFVGAVGDDDAAAELLAALRAADVDVSNVGTVRGPSGTAVVVVDDHGENCIVVAPGANAKLTELSADQLVTIQRAAVLVAQLEIPVATVAMAAYAARETGARVVLNAAPARVLPAAVLDAVDLLVVNLGEAAALVGLGPADPAAAPVDALLTALLEIVPAVAITLGQDGSVHADRNGPTLWIPAVQVDVVDTTGAGDTFTGALAAAMTRGTPVPVALRFASAAAAAAVTRRGAVDSIPDRSAIESMLAGTSVAHGVSS